METIEKIGIIAALALLAWLYMTRRGAAPAAPAASDSFAPWYVNYNYPIGMTGNAMADMPVESIGFDGIPTTGDTCAICSMFMGMRI